MKNEKVDFLYVRTFWKDFLWFNLEYYDYVMLTDNIKVSFMTENHARIKKKMWVL